MAWSRSCTLVFIYSLLTILARVFLFIYSFLFEYYIFQDFTGRLHRLGVGAFDLITLPFITRTISAFAQGSCIYTHVSCGVGKPLCHEEKSITAGRAGR